LVRGGKKERFEVLKGERKFALRAVRRKKGEGKCGAAPKI